MRRMKAHEPMTSIAERYITARIATYAGESTPNAAAESGSARARATAPQR
jgi:hypothetical protein